MAAGELVIEDEEPFDTYTHNDCHDDNNDGSEIDSGIGSYNSSGDGEKPLPDMVGAARRNAAVKSTPPELNRLLS